MSENSSIDKPSGSAIRKLYTTDIRKNLSLLRKKKRTAFLVSALLLIVIAGLMVFSHIFSDDRSVFYYILTPSTIIFIYFGIKFATINADLRRDFKNKIVFKVFRTFFPHCEYYPNKYVPRQLYHLSGLFPRRCDKYEGSDLVRASYKKIKFIFSDIHSKKVVFTLHSDRSEKTIFKGFLLAANLPRKVYGSVFVYPDKFEKLFGQGIAEAAGKMQKAPGDLIRLENADFEKTFKVYATDPVFARKVLTPAMMENILSLNKMFEKTISLSFTGTRFYAAMPLKKDSFEPDMLNIINDEKLLSRIANHFYLGLSIIKNLDIKGKK